MTIVPGPIVIVGRNGQVGRSLWNVLSSQQQSVVRLGRPDVDLLNPRSVTDAIATLAPSIVINAAAYTAVDNAEDEPDVAEAVNATAAGMVAEAATCVGAPIIHFSTDYVFDGQKGAPYLETDEPSPLGVYGRTKLTSEHRVAAANPKHVILRTSWVFSPFGRNFVKTILRLASERPEISVVDDQRGNPTYAYDLARTVAAMLPKISRPAPDPNRFGIFHAANDGDTTWFHFARSILETGAEQRRRSVAVRPIRTEDYPAKAKRPTNSSLSTSKLRAVYGIELRPWGPALAECLAEIEKSVDDMAY